MKALWNGTIIAESDDTVIVEGNHYFPMAALKREFVEPSDTETICAWKGTARYYSLKIGDRINKDAVWFYPEPAQAAAAIRDRVAFWKGVEIREN